MKSVSYKLYIVTFILTLCIFLGALFISGYINKKKTQELQSVEDKITVDILDLDNQLDTLKNKSCSTVTTSSLQTELDSLSSRLTFMEQQVGDQDTEIFRLKRYYSLLETRDYTLVKKAADECNQKIVIMFYFYSTKNCDACTTQQYILQAIQDEYPQVHVYSFDYNLDLPSVQAIISLPHLPPNPPSIDINGTVYPGFTSLSDIEAVIQPLLGTSTASTTPHATSTVKK